MSCVTRAWGNGSGTGAPRRKCQVRSLEMGVVVVFFFSSRRRHTRLQGDWSSDVCSSDLQRAVPKAALFEIGEQAMNRHVSGGAMMRMVAFEVAVRVPFAVAVDLHETNRSEERRVGKECRSRWSPYH